MKALLKSSVVAATLLVSACFGGGPGEADIKKAMLERAKIEIAQMAAVGGMMGAAQLKMALLDPVGPKALGWARKFEVDDYRDGIAIVTMEIADTGLRVLKTEGGKFEIASVKEGVPESGWNRATIRVPSNASVYREAMEAKKDIKVDIVNMQVHGKEKKSDGTWSVTVSGKFVAEGKGENNFTGQKITLVERDGKWVAVD